MSEPSVTAVKTLFAESRNRCFFNDPERARGGCEEQLTDPAWEQVKGQVAHIKGEKPGAARYDADQPDKERQGYGNLLLLCPTCHTRIDRLEPSYFTVERLHEMKDRHLAHPAARAWATEEELVRYTALAIAEYVALHERAGGIGDRASATIIGRGAGPSVSGVLELTPAEIQRRADAALGGVPTLQAVRQADGSIVVTNIGQGVAWAPEAIPIGGPWPAERMALLPPPQLAGGDTWRLGHLDPSVPAGAVRVELVWRDTNQRPYRQQVDL